MKKKNHIISKVLPGSIGEELELEVGDMPDGDQPSGDRRCI